MADFINTVDVVGDEALTSSIIDKTVTEYKDDGVIALGQYAFTQCVQLAEVDVPKVTSIPTRAFNGCSQLTRIDLSNMTSIGDAAFQYCKKLEDIGDISNVTLNGGFIFSECNLKTFRNLGVYLDGGHIVSRNPNLVSVDFPNATRIGYGVCQGCSSLTSVNMPEVSTLGNSAFGQCSSLEYINLPKVTKLEASSFQGCSKLKVADFGAVTSANFTNLFAGCNSLDTLIIRTNSVFGLSATWDLGTTPLGGYKGLTGTLYVPAALVESYKAATNWSVLYANGTCNIVAIEGSEYE